MRFYIYFDSDYELDADSVEEKNKVGINFKQNSCGSVCLGYIPSEAVRDAVSAYNM